LAPSGLCRQADSIRELAPCGQLLVGFPAKARVLRAIDGEPVQGATVKILDFDGPGDGYSCGPGDGAVWARSDDAGQIVWRTLRAGWRYWFHVEADGLAPRIVGPVRSREKLGYVLLVPAIEITGEIRAAPGELRHPTLAWSQPCSLEIGHSRPAGGYKDYGNRTGSVPFRITGLRLGEVYVTLMPLGNPIYEANVRQSVHGLVITPHGVRAWPAPKSDSQPRRLRRFVRLVVGEGAVTFEGRRATWQQLPALLSQVLDRAHTVRQVGLSPRVNRFGSRIPAWEMARRFGFEYLKYLDKTPLGSKGPPAGNAACREKRRRCDEAGGEEGRAGWRVRTPHRP